MAKKKKNNKNFIISIDSKWFPAAFIFFIVLILGVSAYSLSANEKFESVKFEPLEVLTPAPTVNPQDENPLAPLPSYAITNTPIPRANDINSDPIITCKINTDQTNCKGQTVTAKQSICKIKNYFVCCEIGKGVYKIIEKSACDNILKSDENSSGNYNYKAPDFNYENFIDTDIKIDCVIDGNYYGEVDPSVCSDLMYDYYSKQINETPSLPSSNTNSQDGISFQEAVNKCLRIFSASGTADSSEAQKCYSNPYLYL